MEPVGGAVDAPVAWVLILRTPMTINSFKVRGSMQTGGKTEVFSLGMLAKSYPRTTVRTLRLGLPVAL
jgi:hypothetical protein